ncbi:hypothetical protein T492DRAFT_1130211 [Pavlovales sp. CCMP2436]|nr:hypothetical protein T492DRAFT_1130211 [Pavlovales sp. CCMP2436]
MVHLALVHHVLELREVRVTTVTQVLDDRLVQGELRNFLNGVELSLHHRGVYFVKLCHCPGFRGVGRGPPVLLPFLRALDVLRLRHELDLALGDVGNALHGRASGAHRRPQCDGIHRVIEVAQLLGCLTVALVRAEGWGRLVCIVVVWVHLYLCPAAGPCVRVAVERREPLAHVELTTALSGAIDLRHVRLVTPIAEFFLCRESRTMWGWSGRNTPVSLAALKGPTTSDRTHELETLDRMAKNLNNIRGVTDVEFSKTEIAKSILDQGYRNLADAHLADYKVQADADMYEGFSAFLSGDLHKDTTKRYVDVPFVGDRGILRHMEEGHTVDFQVLDNVQAKCVPWDDHHLLHIPGAHEFLTNEYRKRKQFDIYIGTLYAMGPQSMEQAWHYYKYIVKQQRRHEAQLTRSHLGKFGRAGRGMYTVLRPYARKFANAYAQEAEVNAVRVIDSADVTNLVVRSKTDMSGTILMRGAATFGAAKFSGATTFEGPAEMMSTVLMRGAATFGGLVEMMGDLYVRGAASFVDAEFTGPTTIMGPADLMGTLLLRGTSVFNGKVEMMGDLLVNGAAFLPTLTYLNGTLLEAPISIKITGCTTSDSWLVETDNTLSEFQVQATAAFNPVTLGALDAMCKVSPKFNTNVTIANNALWPVGTNGWTVTASSSSTSVIWNAFDKNTTTSWTSNASTYNTTTGFGSPGVSWIQVMYPYAVIIKSFTLTNSPDVRTVRLECSPNGTYYNTVQSWTRTMTSGVESFPVTIGNYPNQFWRLSIVTIATGGNSYCSVGEWELFSSRGPVSLMSAVPTSLSTFKLMLTDAQGIIINMTGIAQEMDINLCLTKGGKVANSGLYRFGPGASGSLGVVTKLT